MRFPWYGLVPAFALALGVATGAQAAVTTKTCLLYTSPSPRD